MVAPPQLQGFVAQAAQSGKGAAVSSAQSALGQDYAMTLAPTCHAVVDNHYPFFGTAPNDATAAEVSLGGTTYRFEPSTVGAKTFMWSLNSLPEAHVVLYAGKVEARRFDGQGVWALFRLMDTAQKENAGPTAIKATFGQGAQFFTMKVELPSDQNPFGRGGLWSFRCPAKL